METIADLWEIIKEKLRDTLQDTAYNVWINTVKPIDLNGQELILEVPSNLYRNVLISRYEKEILARAKELTGLSVALVVNTAEEGQAAGKQAPAQPDSESEEFTFDNFVVGNTNRYAYAAATAVAQNPGNAYNPLFIYGPSGNGKTHILYAIRDKISKENPGKNIIYIKGDEFTNELIEAIGKGKQMDFRKKYRYADVFLMDDVQFISGKEQTQEEFFHTFNTLHQEKKQIVLTSDRPPMEIKVLQERLQSRFVSGVLADIQPPEFETRVAIVKKKAHMLNLPLSDSVAEFIAEKLKTSVRQLEGVVKNLKVIIGVSGDKLTIAMAQNAIKDILSNTTPTPMTVERIITEVARAFEVPADEIPSIRRTAPLSTARQVAMYVIREVTSMSYEAIGNEFSGRDHTTVIYAVQQVQARMKTQPTFRATVEDIIKNVKN